jgi:DNA-binding SARP family transcriptional activator
MSKFLLLTLGSIRLVHASSGVSLSLGARTLAMLAFLARQPGREADRLLLAATVWGHGGARPALRQTVFALRRRLGAVALAVEGGSIRLGPVIETDFERFARDATAGRAEAACACGSFCEGLEPVSEAFDEWLVAERARVAQEIAGSLADIAAAAEDGDRLDRAIFAARELVALDPFDDAAQARLIALYRRRGWTTAARLAHRRCIGLFHRELGVPPGPEVQVAARTPLPLPTRPPPAAALAGRRSGTALLGLGIALMAATATVELRFGGDPAMAAPKAVWVGVAEWQPDAPIESRDLPLAEAIDRALAGDPTFAHLRPTGC